MGVASPHKLPKLQEGGGEPLKGTVGWAIDEDFGCLEALVSKMNAEGAALQVLDGWYAIYWLLLTCQ
ncbi:hypothetical protein MLD38_011073 [Melastoma candidum]|uniref:Uncharacterized protein n=1 Tax=Melastoma candidum TaxID=119954 RepID=A0ACB9R4Y0_9MYRT|nr:hypothetical protein MLD38_011073 [Melastoma candidum]